MGSILILDKLGSSLFRRIQSTKRKISLSFKRCGDFERKFYEEKLRETLYKLVLYSMFNLF